MIVSAVHLIASPDSWVRRRVVWPEAWAKVEMQGYEAAAAQGPARLGPVDPQSSQGKALYVGNLHSSVSQEMLQVCWCPGRMRGTS